MIQLINFIKLLLQKYMASGITQNTFRFVQLYHLNDDKTQELQQWLKQRA